RILDGEPAGFGGRLLLVTGAAPFDIDGREIRRAKARLVTEVIPLYATPHPVRPSDERLARHLDATEPEPLIDPEAGTVRVRRIGARLVDEARVMRELGEIARRRIGSRRGSVADGGGH